MKIDNQRRACLRCTTRDFSGGAHARCLQELRRKSCWCCPEVQVGGSINVPTKILILHPQTANCHLVMKPQMPCDGAASRVLDGMTLSNGSENSLRWHPCQDEAGASVYATSIGTKGNLPGTLVGSCGAVVFIKAEKAKLCSRI